MVSLGAESGSESTDSGDMGRGEGGGEGARREGSDCEREGVGGSGVEDGGEEEAMGFYVEGKGRDSEGMGGYCRY